MPGPWRTGDLGCFDPDDFLIIRGRKDNVIVTAAGRNVSPEWIEETLALDERVRRCVVVEHEQELVAVIVPADAALCDDPSAISCLVDGAARELPDYAKPRRYLAMSEQEFRSLDLLTANCRPRRHETRNVVLKRSGALRAQYA